MHPRITELQEVYVGVRVGERVVCVFRLDEVERLCEASGRREVWLELGRTALANLDIELGVLLLLFLLLLFLLFLLLMRFCGSTSNSTDRSVLSASLSEHHKTHTHSHTSTCRVNTHSFERLNAIVALGRIMALYYVTSGN